MKCAAALVQRMMGADRTGARHGVAMYGYNGQAHKQVGIPSVGLDVSGRVKQKHVESSTIVATLKHTIGLHL